MVSSRRGGGVSKRCECRGDDGRRLGAACPKLTQRKHGSHRLTQELPVDGDGRRRRFQRIGYGSVGEAQADLDKIRAILDLAVDDEDGQRRVGDLLAGLMKTRGPIPEPVEVARKLGVGVPLDGKMLVSEWLDVWLASKKTRPTTTNSYRSHVDYHLKPGLGHLRLDRLGVGHLVEFFDSIDEQNKAIVEANAKRREQVAKCTRGKPGAPKAEERAALAEAREQLAEMPPFRRVTGASTKQAIRRTLRISLNAAIARQMITFNAASHVELESGRRPKPQLWTDERVARWRETGEVPGAVMVWTPQLFGEFLDAAEGERLYPLYHLVGFRGLRRGEACGQGWADVNLDDGLLTVSKELVVDGWEVVETEPKTDGSAGTIGLDSVTVAVLREHRDRQLEEKAAAGEKWTETGKAFVTETGEWLHPSEVSETFRRIVAAADLPPINLRDLRHVSATVQHAGGADLHAIKETLRHSTITLTSDTYTSLLPEVDKEIAERAAAMVPRARRAPAEAPAPVD